MRGWEKPTGSEEETKLLRCVFGNGGDVLFPGKHEKNRKTKLCEKLKHPVHCHSYKQNEVKTYPVLLWLNEAGLSLPTFLFNYEIMGEKEDWDYTDITIILVILVEIIILVEYCHTPDTLDEIRKKWVSIDVFDSLNDFRPPPLWSMFECFDHGKDTWGNGSRLRLPKVKTEAGRKIFAFQGTLIFNGLPTDLRNEAYFVNFKRKLNTVKFVW